MWISIASVIKGDKHFPMCLFIGCVSYLWLLVHLLCPLLFWRFSVFPYQQKQPFVDCSLCRCSSYRLLCSFSPSWHIVPILMPIFNNLSLIGFQQLGKITESKRQNWDLNLSPSACVLNHNFPAPFCTWQSPLYNKNLNIERYLFLIFSNCLPLK